MENEIWKKKKPKLLQIATSFGFGNESTEKRWHHSCEQKFSVLIRNWTFLPKTFDVGWLRAFVSSAYGAPQRSFRAFGPRLLPCREIRTPKCQIRLERLLTKTKRSDFIPNTLGLDRRNWAGYCSSRWNNGSLMHKAARPDQAGRLIHRTSSTCQQLCKHGVFPPKFFFFFDN